LVGQYHCGHLQAALAGRIILQMDQAESENKEFHRNQHECSGDSDYGGALRLPYFEMAEIYVLFETKPNANHSTASVEFIR